MLDILKAEIGVDQCHHQRGRREGEQSEEDRHHRAGGAEDCGRFEPGRRHCRQQRHQGHEHRHAQAEVSYKSGHDGSLKSLTFLCGESGSYLLAHLVIKTSALNTPASSSLPSTTTSRPTWNMSGMTP